MKYTLLVFKITVAQSVSVCRRDETVPLLYDIVKVGWAYYAAVAANRMSDVRRVLCLLVEHCTSTGTPVTQPGHPSVARRDE